MTSVSIHERVKTLKSSSIFSAGDPFSFAVPLGNDLRLPGRHDPASYLELIGADLRGKSVCIVCPGNAGLCVEAIRSAATYVAAYEPRALYQRALQAVWDLSGEIFGQSFDPLKTLDKPGSFDVVIWSEGVDDLHDPKLIIDGVIRSVAPSGTLYLELSHGTAGVLPDRINSWRPSKSGLVDTIKNYPGMEIVKESDGRNQTRKIYTIRNTSLAVAPISPENPPSIAVLSAGDAPRDDDIEYFRKMLMASVLKMRESDTAQEKPAQELSEAYDRTPEPSGDKVSTPKSKRRPKS